LFSVQVIAAPLSYLLYKCYTTERLEKKARELSNDELLLFTVPAGEEQRNEFCRKGSWYDVIRTEQHNGLTYLYCITAAWQ
jgi:hypothetical protein